MANLVTIDLDKTIILELPNGVDKEKDLGVIADYYNYEKGEEKVEQKTFSGTYEDYKAFIVANNVKAVLVEIRAEDNEVIYNETIYVPYALTKVEFGILKFIAPAFELFKQIKKEKETEELQAKVKDAQKALKDSQDSLGAILDQIL